VIEAENNGHSWAPGLNPDMTPTKDEHCGFCGIKRTKASEKKACPGPAAAIS
jgi:hypothetical protein